MPAERGTERARRAVADTFGDYGKREVAPEQIFGDRHWPSDQVFHRWQADGAREAFEECRARQRRRLRDLGDRSPASELTDPHTVKRLCGELPSLL
jgi:hypothetical protein